METNELSKLKIHKNYENISKKINQSIYIGCSQFFLIFALGHPFDLMKTQMQASLISHNSTFFALPKQIYTERGIFGFYKAGLPNFTRGFLKELYRSPSRGFFNYFYSKSLTTDIQKNYPDLKNLLTGLTISSLDTLISCPLERVKVWLMTNKNRNESLFSYFIRNKSFFIEITNKNKNNFYLIDLFRGLNVSFYRSSISWCSFLVIEERIRKLITNESKRLNRINEPGNLPIVEQMIIGTLCGILNCLLTLPFDTVKTHLQKRDNHELKFKSEPFFKIMKNIYMKNGLDGLYSGWHYSLPHYVIIAMITSANLQRMDKIWNNEL